MTITRKLLTAGATTLALLGNSAVQAQTAYQVGFEYLTFSATEDRYDGVTTESVKNKYEIEDSTWITLTGSHKFSSDFYGFFDISSKQADAANNLKLLAALASDEFIFRTRRGEYVGSFSQAVQDGTAAQTEDVDTKYFSFDAQYHAIGIRYIDMAAPTILEYPLTINLIDDRTESGDGLDPEFEIQGYMIFVQADSFRTDLLKPTIRPDWYASGSVFAGLGYGDGTISQIGMTNFNERSETTITSDALPVIMAEFNFKLGLSRDMRLGATGKMSMEFAYGLNMFHYENWEDPAFEDPKVEQDIIQHGPSFTLGLTY